MRREGIVYSLNVDNLGEVLTTPSLEYALLARAGWERRGHVVSIFVVETSRLGRS
jgi:1,2-phenylacetyl-CoA epoxidase PaaB subunit